MDHFNQLWGDMQISLSLAAGDAIKFAAVAYDSEELDSDMLFLRASA